MATSATPFLAAYDFVPPPQFPKRCAMCGCVFTAKGWAHLKLKGVYQGEEETLEMRDCPCGNTLSVIIPTSELP